MDLTYTYRVKPVTQRPFMVSRGWEETDKFYISNWGHIPTMYQVFRKAVRNNIYN